MVLHHHEGLVAEYLFEYGILSDLGSLQKREKSFSVVVAILRDQLLMLADSFRFEAI